MSPRDLELSPRNLPRAKRSESALARKATRATDDIGAIFKVHSQKDGKMNAAQFSAALEEFLEDFDMALEPSERAEIFQDADSGGVGLIGLDQFRDALTPMDEISFSSDVYGSGMSAPSGFTARCRDFGEVWATSNC